MPFPTAREMQRPTEATDEQTLGCAVSEHSVEAIKIVRGGARRDGDADFAERSSLAEMGIGDQERFRAVPVETARSIQREDFAGPGGGDGTAHTTTRDIVRKLSEESRQRGN